MAWLKFCCRRFLASALFGALLGSPAQAELDKALAAYESGEFEVAFIKLLPLAEEENIIAQYHLGEMYRLGNGVESDPDKGEHWLRRAAEGGYPPAQFRLGELYALGARAYGSNLSEDRDESARWYLKAAAAGHSDAQFQLGALYFLGLGVEQNEAEAFRWYQKAAEKGDAAAQHKVAGLYAHGWGIEKDQRAAVDLLRKAATQGYLPAVRDLALAYDIGEGVPVDHTEAIKWYQLVEREAKTAGEVPLGRIGYLYAEGLGVTADPARAFKYFIAHSAVVMAQCLELDLEDTKGQGCSGLDMGHETEIEGLYEKLDFEQMQNAAEEARALLAGYGEDAQNIEAAVFQVMLEYEQRFR